MECQKSVNLIDRLYYYGLGTRFGASRPFEHARSIDFCTFWRTFLAWHGFERLSFFFSLLERHNRCLVMCSSNVGTGKSPGLSDFHPYRSRQSLAIALGQSSWPQAWLSSARTTLKRNNPSHAGGEMLVWIINCENGATSVVFKCESLGSDIRGSVRKWVRYVSPLSVCQNYKRRSTPNKIVHLVIFFYSSRFEKEKRKRLLLSCQGARRAELIAARRCTWSTSILVLIAAAKLIYSLRKSSVLPSFLDFSSCVGWPSTYTQATTKILSRQFSAVQVLRGH